jgi:peptidoglycan-N-acetylglucosamine deacetylase
MGILAGLVLGVVVVGSGLFWYACSVPSSQILCSSLVRGPLESPSVALTFDDGPASPFTEQILDTLRTRQVTATFFVCGQNVERRPDLVRRILAEGHSLGNHTYSHPFLYFRGRTRIAKEIDLTQQAIERIVGQQPRVFRAPYGVRWFGLAAVLRERGLRAVQWSDAGGDWKTTPQGIVKRLVPSVRAGSVILLHDGHEVLPPGAVDRSATVSALPQVIDGIRQRGFRFVSLFDFLPS